MADSLDALAERHGVSTAAVQALQEALRRGGGHQAQFSHPDLGGMGQWSSGGMTQVGDMFNTALRDKVAALCTELAGRGAEPGGPAEPRATADAAPRRDWWPDGLGRPSATGDQNGMRYACFPDAHRVAVEQGGDVTVYDSGEHQITGVSQSQSGAQELVFSSRSGSVSAFDLPVASQP